MDNAYIVVNEVAHPAQISELFEYNPDKNVTERTFNARVTVDNTVVDFSHVAVQDAIKGLAKRLYEKLNDQ